MYMTPEQLVGAVADARTDVFQLGVVFFEMLTGRAPAEGRPIREMVDQLRGGPRPVPSASSKGLPANTDYVVSRAMATDPKDRFASAAEFAAALTPYTGVAGLAWKATWWLSK